MVSWGSVAYKDYARVAISFDKPKYCVLLGSNDDKDAYLGLSYSFVIDGYLQNNEKYEVNAYAYKIFGITIKQGEASPQKDKQIYNYNRLNKSDNNIFSLYSF